MTTTPTLPRPPARHDPPDLTPSQRLARARELDDRIQTLHRRSNADNAQIAHHLFELQKTGGHLALGFQNLNAYSLDRLGWRRKKTEEMLRLVLRLGELPLLEASFDAGDIDWTKAVVAARAAALEPQKEEQWAEDAKALPIGELKKKASGVTGEELQVRMVLEFSLEQAALLQQGDRGFASEGVRLTREERFVEAYVRMLERGAVGSSKFRALVVHDPDRGQTSVPTPEGDVPLSPETAERVLCGAELQERKGGKEVVTRRVPASVRKEITRRSRGICEIPSCTLAACEDHHLRGRGAGHDPDFLLHVCKLCRARHNLHYADFQIMPRWRIEARVARRRPVQAQSLAA